MMTGPSNIHRRQIPFNSLVPFLVIAFGIAWGILACFIFLPEQMTRMFGRLTGQHPLFYLAVYAPAIAAFFVIMGRSGVEGLKRYLSRLFLWKCSLSWYIFLIMGVPLIFVCGSVLKGSIFVEPFPFSSFHSLFLGLVFAALKGPVEEFGWRGLALPLLQRRLVPFWAGLILGVIWGLWHLPAFLLSGTQQSGWSFTPFFVGCIALSLIVTALFNASHGSILLPALFHFVVMNPVLPDAQPYDTYLFLGAAVLVVWFNREDMFTRKGAATEVIPNLQV